ncbi:MAG: ABC transporter ATP-binding protein [Acidimicrobiales bacterium]
MIELIGLTKRYGERTAVDALTLTVRPGEVTGFLGPNGAGKSTTMRLILGLDRPTAGRARVAGMPLAEHRAPLQAIGALLDAKGVHPNRSARNHLRALAATTGIDDRRVDEVLRIVGIEGVSGTRAGRFSLGMGQRLGLAAALLGDPTVVMLDEPINGLDPEGIVWMRKMLRHLADEGRTVFVSSHLMTEMALVADRFVIIGRGRLLADLTAAEVQAHAVQSVMVRTPDPISLRQALCAAGATVIADGSDTLAVTGLDSASVGRQALRAGVELHELTPVRSSLEDVFVALTQDAVEYSAQTPAVAA